MSHFYWQNALQTTNSQSYGDDASRQNNSDESTRWSFVGLNNESTTEKSQQQSFWWSKQNELETDPYSAAVFEGFRASSDSSAKQNWQNSVKPYNSDVYSTQAEQITTTMEGIESEVNDARQRLFGIHQPILETRNSNSIHTTTSVVDDQKTEGTDTGQHSQILFADEYSEGIDQLRNNTLLVDEKGNQEDTAEPENGVPIVAVAQVTPMIATSITSTTETSFTQPINTSINNQTSAPSIAANVARVGPLSNQQTDSSGFSVNRVAPTVQSATIYTASTQSASVLPVASNTTSVSVNESDETENVTAPVVAQLIPANNKSVMNCEQEESTEKPANQEMISDNAPTQSAELISIQSNQPPLEASQIEQEARNGPRIRPIKEIKKENPTVMTSTEQSTDSAAQEDVIIERQSGKHKDSKNVRDRYRIIRQQYPEVVKRLDRLRMETHGADWRPIERTPSIEIGSSSHQAVSDKVKQKNMVPMGVDPDVSANLKNVGQAMVDSRSSSKMNHSFTVPERMSSEESSRNDIHYGEDFVNSLRRSRHARTREYDYIPSRGTKSEMGEIGPYRGPALALHKHYMMQHGYGYNSSAGHPNYNYHPSGRQSLGPYIGRRVAHELAAYDEMNSLHRRPQSSFDSSAHAIYQNKNEYVQDSHRKVQMDNSSENDDETSGSDSEIARIHYEQEMTRRAAAMRFNTMPVAAPNEFYYFGVIQLPQERLEHILCRMPPPPEYYQLPPIEKAAYMFYCVLYQHHYHPVDLFHKKFNREYYGYMCNGDSAEVALWKICKHTQEEFLAKRSANHLKAYEMSQKQLFSDDRETLDSRNLVASSRSSILKPYKRSSSEPLQSERGSRCDPEDESDLSIDSALREPMKFRAAHSFLKFGIAGRAILLNVENSENILEIRNLTSLIKDKNLLRLSNAIEQFRGPLIAGYTPTHSVRLYVQRQIELILKSEVYRSSPTYGSASDCLLIWQLLEMLVQQQGRVTGPDLSRLLMTGCHVTEHRRHIKEKSQSPSEIAELSIDPMAYDRFTQLLLGGHIKEALDSAIKDRLYSDAMILARRICANEGQELERIEAAFLSHRSEQNPVMTLLAVANGQPAPFLTNPPIDEANSWRSHAAIVLANLNTPAALGTIYQLGRVLARRELHAAADFCFLSVSLLAPDYNPFQPVPRSENESGNGRQHITLIHATSLKDNEMNFDCPKGFSVIDLHATEIFEYALKLAVNNGIPVHLSASVAYQLCRLDYAEMICEFGNSAADAFRYCVDIAKGIWNQCNEIDVEQLERLYELAERLKFLACADAESTAWLPVMQSVIDERRKMINDRQYITVKQDLSVDQDANQRVEDADLTLVAKVSTTTEMADNSHETTESQNTGVVNAVVSDSEAVKWQIGEPVTDSASSSADQENKYQLQNEYRMQPGQRNRTYSSTSTSANTSQYVPIAPAVPAVAPAVPTVAPAIPTVAPAAPAVTPAVSTVAPAIPTAVSVSDSVECSHMIHATMIPSSTLPSQTDEQFVNFYDNVSDRKDATLTEQRSDLNDADSDERTEITTEGNTTTATSSHESTPRRNLISNMEDKFSNVITSNENQNEGKQHLGYMPPVLQHTDSSQHRNYSSEQSRRSQQQVDSTKMNEKVQNKSKIMSESRQNVGLFSKLKARIAKAIPSSNEMVLPDDKNPSIVWDPKLNRYVGEGVEEEHVPEPPPSAIPSSDKLNGSTHGSFGGLTAARLSGGSRYFNPLIETAPAKPALQTAPLLPPVPVSTNFGFIPSMPDSDGAVGESPFSVDTGPPPQQQAEVAE